MAPEQQTSCARFELVEEVRVVRLEGCASDADLREAIDALGDHAGPTVLDLADVTLVAPVDDLVDRSGAVGIVARRHTARVLLRRSGVAERCHVFTSIADALRALAPSEEVAG